MKFEITINRETKSIEANAREILLDVLRNEGFFGVKRGCSEGSCGSCMILVDGIPRKSCIMFVGQVQGKSVTTIEGLGDRENAHPIQDAFIDNGAAQCGYCIPGMILSASSLLEMNKAPTVDEIKESLAGNLCRCTGYVKQIEAVQNAAAVMRGEK
ncbi:MAG: (2Fe-2S)-binding protein [Candidatus Heimdallarchaeota archaeon]|nr:(2Fe-2S)-binding protein [Candidatus Heimdallarchaeota archaeon]